MTKYHRWCDRIVSQAQNREFPTCYTEVHHIKPRALGGSDDPSNLVRLTYREHFLVHWLLTKTTTGKDRRAMQHAINAMTISLLGRRIISGWQFEAAKRAIKDLQDDPEVHAAFMARYERAKQEREGAELAKLFDRRIERDIGRAQVETDVAEAAKLSKQQANDLADRMLKYRSGKQFRTNVYKGPSQSGPRKRHQTELPINKKLFKQTNERLKKLGLRLNG